MEPTSLISVTAREGATYPRSGVASPPLSQPTAALPPPPRALSVGLPLRFFLAGLAALFGGVVWLAARPDLLATYHYNQYVIAVTHLFTLGAITSIIMGATYQLVPVALETRLYSERLAEWQFFLHVVGVAGMVWMFWRWNLAQVGHFGSLVGVGILFYVYNLGRTLKRSPRRDVIVAGIAAALGWLVLALLAGLYLAADKCWSFSPFATMSQMHAHAHLGVLGFFVMMIVAVSLKLVPMFALSEVQNWRRAAWAVGLLNAGLAGLFVAILVGSVWKLAFALVVIGGLGVYGWELVAILRARKRRHLDWGVRYFLTAVALLAPVSVIGAILAWPNLPATPLTTQLENVYGLLALLGVITLAILGMLYKILPFLVWYHRYSGEIGRCPVPALAELYSASLQAAGYGCYVGGLAAASVATALGNGPDVRWSCALLAVGLLFFGVNLGKMLRHLVRPHPRPAHWRPLSEEIV